MLLNKLRLVSALMVKVYYTDYMVLVVSCLAKKVHACYTDKHSFYRV